MNIALVSQNYPPDIGAAAFRMHALAKALHERGHRVYVIAGMPNRYREFVQEDPVPDHENADEAEVFRVSIKIVGNSKLARICGYIEFFWGSVGMLSRLRHRRIDIVVATTPQLLQAVVGQFLARRLNAKLLIDVRDLWPDTPIALGELRENSLTARALATLERIVCRRADHLVVTSPGYVEHVRRSAGKSVPVSVVMNGIDEEFMINAISPRRNDVMTVLYAGNVGYCQNLLTLVEAAAVLRHEGFRFRIIGSGTQLDQVKRRIVTLALENFEVIPPVRRPELVTAYQEADILYLQLFSSDYFKKVIPSKIFEYLAVSRPIVYGLNGVSAEILARFSHTYRVTPDNPQELADTLRSVAAVTETGAPIRRNPDELAAYTRARQTSVFVKAVEDTCQ